MVGVGVGRNDKTPPLPRTHRMESDAAEMLQNQMSDGFTRVETRIGAVEQRLGELGGKIDESTRNLHERIDREVKDLEERDRETEERLSETRKKVWLGLGAASALGGSLGAALVQLVFGGLG